MTQLHIDYCEYFDAGNAHAWARLFHPHGVWAGAHRPTYRGRPALEAYLRDHHRPELHHFTVHSTWSEDHSGTIHATARFLITASTTEQGIELAMLGHYDDELVLHDGRLVFSRRESTLHPTTRSSTAI